MSIIHPQQAFAPAPQVQPSEKVTAANAAHARAMPVSRMLDYGMTYADAVALHRMAGEGVAWSRAGEWLGQCNRQRAHAAVTAHTRARAHLAACACFRFAQSALENDGVERTRLYALVMQSFEDAAGLLPVAPSKLVFPTTSGDVFGWLFQPVAEATSVVVVLGGADGWREAYYTQALALLAEGQAVLLLDGPGQGESRLFHQTWLTDRIGLELDGVAADLKQKFKRVGVWGNSLGGSFAMQAAAAGSNIDAVCSNSGAAHPAEAGVRFPRFLDKIAAMAGSTDRGEGARLLEALDLSDVLSDLICPLLVLHGAADALFSQDNVQDLHDLAAADDRTMLIWNDGEHCLYSHAEERNAIVASWFSKRLIDERSRE